MENTVNWKKAYIEIAEVDYIKQNNDGDYEVYLIRPNGSVCRTISGSKDKQMNFGLKYITFK